MVMMIPVNGQKGTAAEEPIFDKLNVQTMNVQKIKIDLT